MSLGLHVMCPILLSDFNQIWSFSTHFHKSPQYKISRKSVQLEPRRNMRPDRRTRHDAVNMHFSRLIPTRLEASEIPVTLPKIGIAFTQVRLTNWYFLFYVHVTVHRNKFLYNKTNQMHRDGPARKLSTNLYDIHHC